MRRMVPKVAPAEAPVSSTVNVLFPRRAGICHDRHVDDPERIAFDEGFDTCRRAAIVEARPRRAADDPPAHFDVKPGAIEVPERNGSDHRALAHDHPGRVKEDEPGRPGAGTALPVSRPQLALPRRPGTERSGGRLQASHDSPAVIALACDDRGAPGPELKRPIRMPTRRGRPRGRCRARRASVRPCAASLRREGRGDQDGWPRQRPPALRQLTCRRCNAAAIRTRNARISSGIEGRAARFRSSPAASTSWRGHPSKASGSGTTMVPHASELAGHMDADRRASRR